MWNMEKQEKTLIGVNYNWKFQCGPLIFKERNCMYVHLYMPMYSYKFMYICIFVCM